MTAATIGNETTTSSAISGRPDRTTLEGMLWSANLILDKLMSESSLFAPLLTDSYAVVLAATFALPCLMTGNLGTGVLIRCGGSHKPGACAVVLTRTSHYLPKTDDDGAAGHLLPPYVVIALDQVHAHQIVDNEPGLLRLHPTTGVQIAAASLASSDDASVPATTTTTPSSEENDDENKDNDAPLPQSTPTTERPWRLPLRGTLVLAYNDGTWQEWSAVPFEIVVTVRTSANCQFYGDRRSARHIVLDNATALTAGTDEGDGGGEMTLLTSLQQNLAALCPASAIIEDTLPPESTEVDEVVAEVLDELLTHAAQGSGSVDVLDGSATCTETKNVAPVDRSLLPRDEQDVQPGPSNGDGDDDQWIELDESKGDDHATSTSPPTTGDDDDDDEVRGDTFIEHDMSSSS